MPRVPAAPKRKGRRSHWGAVALSSAPPEEDERPSRQQQQCGPLGGHTVDLDAPLPSDEEWTAGQAPARREAMGLGGLLVRCFCLVMAISIVGDAISKQRRAERQTDELDALDDVEEQQEHLFVFGALEHLRIRSSQPAHSSPPLRPPPSPPSARPPPARPPPARPPPMHPVKSTRRYWPKRTSPKRTSRHLKPPPPLHPPPPLPHPPPPPTLPLPPLTPGLDHQARHQAWRVMTDLNRRFAEGAPSNKVSEAGVLVKAFSRREALAYSKGDVQPWLYSKVEEHLSASLMSASLPYYYMGDNYAGPDEATPLWVIDPRIAQRAIKCSFESDAATNDLQGGCGAYPLPHGEYGEPPKGLDKF
eukprot:gene4747-2438_t